MARCKPSLLIPERYRDMTTMLVIDIGTDGSVQGLHMDAFPLLFLGEANISRACEIVWGQETQRWNLRYLGKGVLWEDVRGFDSYDSARNFEIEWLQACRVAGVDPASMAGGDIAGALWRERKTIRV